MTDGILTSSRIGISTQIFEINPNLKIKLQHTMMQGNVGLIIELWIFAKYVCNVTIN